jgi:hypothetical protein
MMKEVKQKLTLDRPATYQIKVPGELDESWSDWAGGMTITVESEGVGPPITTLTGIAIKTTSGTPSSRWVWRSRSTMPFDDGATRFGMSVTQIIISWRFSRSSCILVVLPLPS